VLNISSPSGDLDALLVLPTTQHVTAVTVAMYQALRKELAAVAAGGDLEALAAGDGGLSAGTFGANHDLSNEVGLACTAGSPLPLTVTCAQTVMRVCWDQ
jgi:hypothetical protein